MTIRRDLMSVTGVALQRWRAKAAGRAVTIRRLLAQCDDRESIIMDLLRGREFARRWIRGEYKEPELGSPEARSWACLFCGEMLAGKDHAKRHVEDCDQHPLVQRIRELEQQIERLRHVE